MESSWRRRVGNLRSFIGKSMGGLRGRSNLASWVVAGTIAYFLWIKPSQDLNKQQQERAALAEKLNPIPDPQETGLVYGNQKKSDSKTEE